MKNLKERIHVWTKEHFLGVFYFTVICIVVAVIAAIAIAIFTFKLHNDKILTNAMDAANAGNYEAALKLLDTIEEYPSARRVRGTIERQYEQQKKEEELEYWYQRGIECSEDDNYFSAIKYFALCYNEQYKDAEEYLEYAVCMRAAQLSRWDQFGEIIGVAPWKK